MEKITENSKLCPKPVHGIALHQSGLRMVPGVVGTVCVAPMWLQCLLTLKSPLESIHEVQKHAGVHFTDENIAYFIVIGSVDPNLTTDTRVQTSRS